MAAVLSDVEWAVRVMAGPSSRTRRTSAISMPSWVTADFGARWRCGFEIVLSGWDEFDRTDISTFLKKIAVTITSRIGGRPAPSGVRVPAGSGPLQREAFTRRRPGRRHAPRHDRGDQGTRGRSSSATRPCSMPSYPPPTPSRSGPRRVRLRRRPCVRPQTVPDRRQRRRGRCSRRRGVPRTPASGRRHPRCRSGPPLRCCSRRWPNGIPPRHDVRTRPNTDLEALEVKKFVNDPKKFVPQICTPRAGHPDTLGTYRVRPDHAGRRAVCEQVSVSARLWLRPRTPRT